MNECLNEKEWNEWSGWKVKRMRVRYYDGGYDSKCMGCDALSFFEGKSSASDKCRPIDECEWTEQMKRMNEWMNWRKRMSESMSRTERMKEWMDKWRSEINEWMVATE